MIKIVGLGTGKVDSLTLKTYREIKNNKNLYVRTKEFSTIAELEKEGIFFESYDEKYNTSDLFKSLYEFIADDIIKNHELKGDLVYAVPGHPLVAEKSVTNLIERCKVKGIDYEIYPATSFIDLIMENLEIDASEGLKVVDAFDIREKVINKRDDIIVTQVYNNLIASEVKLKLSEIFSDEIKINYIKISNEGDIIKREINLYELDHQEDLDHTTYIHIPKMQGGLYDFHDLIDIVAVLRGEGGCPWDKVQTHKTIKSDLIEECYEAADAIENDDIIGLEEELGDILLHVVFHSGIAHDDAEFEITDVIAGICKKMIYRHPHVFADEVANTKEDVLKSWDETKKSEKGFETLTQEMDAIAKALPALIRAKKVQKKAAKVNFDLASVEDAMNKVIEELNEIKDVYKSDKVSRIEEEVGDLVFSVVNVARMLNIDPEEALCKTVAKFVKRFSFIENSAIAKGMKLSEMTLEQMDELWEITKNFKEN